MTQKKEQKPRIEVMLDMETCDIAETAAILEVALVPFALDGSETGETHVRFAVDLTSCYMAGMTFGTETQQWWMGKDGNTRARAELIKAEKVTVTHAIETIAAWLDKLNSAYELHLWCRGLNFDLPKLDRCFRHLLDRKELPYPWWLVEDARTYCRAFGVHTADIEFTGNAHTAESDCRHQIKLVQRAYEVRRHLLDCQKIVETAN